VASPRSTDRAAKLAAVDGLTARGETALYDALQTGLRQLSTGAGVRRFVVLLSDGGDTASAATLDATAKALADARVPLFAVELKTAESNAAALARLAEASGGQTVSAADPAALGGVFDGIAKQLVRQYAVSWRSPSSGSVDAGVALEASGVRAESPVRLELPPAAAAGGSRDEAEAASGTAGSWALVAGAALVGLALLLLLLPTALFWTPRSRALRRSGAGARLAEAGEGASAIADRALSWLHQGPAVNALLERAGLDLRPAEYVAGAVSAALLVGLAAAVSAGPWVGLLAAATVVLASRLLLDVLAWRRRERFAEQLGDTLQMLAASLRAGYGLSQGIDVIAREAESPTADEFRRLTVELRLGREFPEALRALAARVGSEDFEWVVQSFEIHQEVGGDLAEILDNVSATIRDRNRVRRQVRALSAEGRMSAAVLYVLPFAMAGVLAVLNPGYLRELTGSGAGQAMLAGTGVLLVAGGVWLHRIVKPTF
jgi:tight adherence protein B